MAARLEIIDETTHGQVISRMTLVLVSERVTARAIVERRVRQEVAAFNKAAVKQNAELIFVGLVQPNDTDRTENGYRLREQRVLDADAQVARAWEAFGRNGFLMLVGERQIESLEDEIVVMPGTQVSFVKLVPLVGG